MLRLRELPEVFDGFIHFSNITWVVPPTPGFLSDDEQFHPGRVPLFMGTDQKRGRCFHGQPLGESGRLLELDITRLELSGQRARRAWQRQHPALFQTGPNSGDFWPHSNPSRWMHGVHKVDRFSQSLTDFARIIEPFDQHGASHEGLGARGQYKSSIV
jgi:hypothetical protein